MKRLFILAMLLTPSLVFGQAELKERFEQHVSTLASTEFGGRAPQTKGDTLAVEYLINEFKKIDNVELLGNDGLQDIDVTAYNRVAKKQDKKSKKAGLPIEYERVPFNIKSFNVVATIKALPENNPEGKSVIVGAHYDHVGMQANKEGKMVLVVGADDNASGCAFVLEYAREISKIQPILKRDVVFILFGAEERGLLGSKYYTEHPIHELDKTVTMFNFDMVGRMRNKGITMRGADSAIESLHLFSTFPNSDNLELIWDFKPIGPTDFASFYKAGIPSFSFSTRLHDDYHTERDTIDKINFDGMVTLFNYVKTMITRFAIEDINLTYKEYNN